MIDVKETLNSAAERMEMAAMYLAEELSHIRAGRANVAILDGVRVNSYGSMVPLNQVATVTTPDARTIAIRPWDKKAIKDIEKAIMDSGVGITPENNGEIVRLGIPQLLVSAVRSWLSSATRLRSVPRLRFATCVRKSRRS